MALLLLVIPVLMVFGALPRRRVVPAAIVTGIWGVGVAGLLSIRDPDAAIWVLCFVLAWLLIANLVPERWSGMARIDAFLRRRSPLRGFALSATVLLLLTGGVECVVFALEASGVIAIKPPVLVMMTAQKEDWRLAAILEAQRLPDPVTFWRPAPHPPYNEQGCKGPVMKVPKPPDLLRVICYGDSNTDGPADGGWAVRLGPALAAALPGRELEVVNAGVSGYSSYQGLRRFEREADHYQPDMILVCFGWNDAPDAIDKPDREFQPPPEPVVKAQHVLLASRAYRYLVQCLRQWRHDAGLSIAVGPRVPIPDYEANLRGFAAHARERGILVVLLTRPHRESPGQLSQRSDWRRLVPAYNDALRQIAAQEGLPLIDLQAAAAAHPGLFIDECHFTLAGHELAARFLALQIPPLLAR